MPKDMSKLLAARQRTAEMPLRSLQDELETLDEHRRAQAERIGRSAAKTYVAWYFKALRGELSVRKAVKIMCYHCCGWDRAEADRCSAGGCPLWAYRPRIARAGR
jgi:hypothetical protein